MELEIAAGMFDALGNPTRLRILHHLANAGEQGMPVGALQAEIGIPNSTLSHHLAKLANVGLVSQERRATTLVCRIVGETLSTLSTYLANPRPKAG
ncbi:ArsR/SmtB family transcription factor [Aureimonas leprariae]|uniref:Helix-turn-helix transcriptional regulator n=1 Tax=Plantimonas leprariae TaxID=2615207 RepID=A0A7V7PJW5_9HYPH|nr:metalloregulator ArsR/SmtB family transcription factor [Aureimonas leprariae]KAB0675604.1 helix-turn-helix transcriptional regulator [Aureimonas leprariae]